MPLHCNTTHLHSIVILQGLSSERSQLGRSIGVRTALTAAVTRIAQLAI